MARYGPSVFCFKAQNSLFHQLQQGGAITFLHKASRFEQISFLNEKKSLLKSCILHLLKLFLGVKSFKCDQYAKKVMKGSNTFSQLVII